MVKKSFILLILITFLAGVLRFYKLGDVPTGFHRDEAFLGYNAYSLLKTGQDMSGNPYPIHLQSFLYSPAGYSYISIPFIALFGLNELSVRFASALFGTFTIAVFYLFVLELLRYTKTSSSIGNFQFTIASISSLLLALSPWHIQLSRTATENIIATFLILLGAYCFLLWQRKRHNIYFLSGSASLWLSLFVYQAPRVFVPLLFVIFVVFFWKSAKTLRQKIVLLSPLVITTLTVSIIFLSPANALRLNSVSIFATPETQLVIDEKLREDGISYSNQIISRLFHNKIIGYTRAFTDNYFAHWSYSFLFTDKGLPDRYRVPGSGLLYLFELPLLFIGIAYLLGANRKLLFFLLAWALVGPVGSAVAFDDIPNLQRTVFTYPALAILSSFGVYKLFMLRKNIAVIRLLSYPLIGLIVFTIAQYFHNYYVHQLVHQPWFRHEGYKQLVSTVNELKSSYHKIVVTNRESSPGIFFLFYNSVDPAYLHSIISGKKYHDFDRVNFDVYEFPDDSCPLQVVSDTKTGLKSLSGGTGVLYANSSTCDIPPSGVKIVKEIKRADGSAVFRLLAIE